MIGSLALHQLEMESLGRGHELGSPGMGKHKLKSPAKLPGGLTDAKEAVMGCCSFHHTDISLQLTNAS